MRHQRDGLAHPSGGVNLTMPLKSMPYRSGRRSGRGFWSGRKLPGGPQAPGRPTSSRAAHKLPGGPQKTIDTLYSYSLH